VKELVVSTACGQEFPVHDQHGRQIGSVLISYPGNSGHPFWDARSLDGCDLGAHINRIEAEEAIQDDWDAGRPRDPHVTAHRWRPILDPHPPVYLGR
jgi:hypothetical protein